MPPSEPASTAEAAQIARLVEDAYLRYGLDFRNYARASLRRRIQSCVAAEGAAGVQGLREKVLRDPECMERLLLRLTVHVTSMFRDPGFYRALLQKVVPVLRTYPFVRIWIAGCSTGEEVYSMAILLHEEGIQKRCRIYATDLSEAVLQRARAGVFPLAAMKEYTTNYLAAGCKGSFSDYYIAQHDAAIFRSTLRENIVFSRHNLVTDASFNEFNLILCRNVMIYFNKILQEHVHKLLYASLSRLGILGLGRKESLKLTPYAACYEPVEATAQLYRKVR